MALEDFIDFVEKDTRWSGLPVGLIHMAIIDHVQWRKQLVGEVVRASTLPPDAPQRRLVSIPEMSCKTCHLGDWYYTMGQSYKDRPAFQEIELPHRALHRAGARLVQLVADGADAKALTPALRDLSQHSMAILGKLQELENEGLHDMYLPNDVIA